MDSTSAQIIILIVLLMLSALFSASETALSSLSKIRLRNMVEEGVSGANKVEELTKSSKNLITTILIGNNLVNIAASSIATSLTIEFFNNSSFALAIATVLTTIAILIFGEVTPKTLAAQNSEKVSLAVVKFVSVCIIIFKPFVFILNIVTSSIIKLIGGDADKDTPIITESEFKTLVKVGEEEGVLENDEKKMITNVFEFGDSYASDVMTPRMDLVAISIDASFEEIKKIFTEEGFTRIPVYRETTDNIEGVIHLRDLAFKEIKNFDIKDYMREVFFTYESKPTSELFKEMQTKRISLAIVIDEYGGTSGIVTLEDLIEEIVGDIDDEYDDISSDIVVIKEDEYIVEGTIRLDDLNEMIGTRFESEEGFDTIGGYIMELLGRIPIDGEIIKDNGVKFIIESLDKNRIEKIRIYT